MNRLLGQQPKLATSATSGPPNSTSPCRAPSADSNSTRSLTSAGKDMPNIVRMHSPSQDPPKHGQSPHIAAQAFNPSVSRKPVESTPPTTTIITTNADTHNNTDNTPTPSGAGNNNNEQKPQFDPSPSSTSPSPPTCNGSAMLETNAEMDPQVKLEDYDWAELEDQFAKRMEAFRAEEDGIWEDWKTWGEVFKAWAATISVHDEERASKRLRTRITFTQGSEESLEAKRQHYIKVVQAFESALALLGNRHSAHNFI